MTTDPVKAKIQELCPDVMELKFGCEVLQNDEPLDWAKRVTLIAYNEKGGLTYYREMDGSLFSIRGEPKNVEILGSPIGIAEVLRALNKTTGMNKPTLYFDGRGLIFNDRIFWNLAEDYDWHVKNKPETIAFIGSLLGVN